MPQGSLTHPKRVGQESHAQTAVHAVGQLPKAGRSCMSHDVVMVNHFMSYSAK
jgi:hypothetical protein